MTSQAVCPSTDPESTRFSTSGTHINKPFNLQVIVHDITTNSVDAITCHSTLLNIIFFLGYIQYIDRIHILY